MLAYSPQTESENNKPFRFQDYERVVIYNYKCFQKFTYRLLSPDGSGIARLFRREYSGQQGSNLLKKPSFSLLNHPFNPDTYQTKTARFRGYY
jgi:hypothetical protein